MNKALMLLILFIAFVQTGFASDYPSATDTFVTKLNRSKDRPAVQSAVSRTVIYAEDINDLFDYISATQNTLGLNPQGSYTTVVERLDALASTTGTSVHNNLTGIQGGASGDYYHLTAAQVASLSQNILTTAGDLIFADASGNIARIPVGSNDQILKIVAGLPNWATVTYIDDPTTTLGDILYRDGSGVTRLAIGSDGQVLKVVGGVPTWAADAGGSGDASSIQGSAVSTASPTNGYALIWNSTLSQYEPTQLTGGVDDAKFIQGTPVGTASPTNGQYLQFNSISGKWEPSIASSPGDATALQGTPISPTSPTDNQVLTYDSGTGQWVAEDATGGSGTIGDAVSIQGTDVNNASPTLDQILQYDGAEWVPTTAAFDDKDAETIWGNDISSDTPSINKILKWDGSKWALADDEDTDTTTTDAESLQGTAIGTASPTSGQVLKYNGSQWEPGTDIDTTTTDAETLQGTPISTASPTTDQILAYNGSQWVPTDNTSVGGSVTLNIPLTSFYLVNGTDPYPAQIGSVGSDTDVVYFNGASDTAIYFDPISIPVDYLSGPATLELDFYLSAGSTNGIGLTLDADVYDETDTFDGVPSDISDSQTITPLNQTSLQRVTTTLQIPEVSMVRKASILARLKRTGSSDANNDSLYLVAARLNYTSLLGSGTFNISTGGNLPAGTQGDLLVYGASDWANLNIGANGTVLKSNGTTATWSTDNDTITASPTALDSTEIDMTVSALNQVSGSLNDGSVAEARLDVNNSPSTDYVLSWNGTKFYWASGTSDLGLSGSGSGFSDPMTTRGDLIYRDSGNSTARLGAGTANQVLTSDGTDIAWQELPPDTNTVTASPTALDTTEADVTISATNQVSVDLIDGSVAESRLDVNNTPSTDYILSWNGSKFYWASGTADLGLGTGNSNYVDPLTTNGDLVLRSGGATTRLPAGTASQVLTISNATGEPIWYNVPSGFSDPMTNRGDLIFRNSSNITDRLPIGATNSVLTSNGTDIDWDTVANSVFGESGDITEIDYAAFDTSAGAPAHAEGKVFYDGVNHSLAVYNEQSDITHQVGFETLMRVYNDTASTITDGTVVYKTGVFNSYSTVAPAIANDVTKSCIVGVATHDITTGSYGYVTVEGEVNGIDLSAFSDGDVLYLSTSTAGGMTATAPNPDINGFFVVRIGAVLDNDAVNGKLCVRLDGPTFASQLTALEAEIGALQGMSVEKHDGTIVNDGGTLYYDLEADGGGDIQFLLDGEKLVLDCTTGSGSGGKARVALTAGADQSTIAINYVYVINNSGTLELQTSTTRPTGSFAWVAKIGLPDVSTWGSTGAYIHQRYTDSLINDSRGALSHEREKIRINGSTYSSGIDVTVNIDSVPSPDDVTLSTTAGVVYQLHRQTFPAFTGNPTYYIVNDSTTPYTTTTNLNTVTTDANGDSMSGRRYVLTLWGVINKSTGECKLMINLPNGTYSSDDQALADVDNTAVTSLPAEFQQVGFLIAKIVLRHRTVSGGTITLIGTVDLRGQAPGFNVGSVTGSSAHSDAAFEVYDDGDDSKKVKFQVSGLTTGTTRTLTVPDTSGTIAVNGAVLTRTNTDVYTPTADYHPATKKYVDDNTSSSLPSSVGGELVVSNLGSWEALATGTVGQVLTMGATGSPTWEDPTGGSSGSTTGTFDMVFDDFYYIPTNSTATSAVEIIMGDNRPVVTFDSTTPRTVYAARRVLPANWNGTALRLKMNYFVSSGTLNNIKMDIDVTVTKAGDSYSGTSEEINLSHEFTLTAVGLNMLVLDTSDFDIASASLEAGAVIELKISRESPSGTNSTSVFNLLSVIGEFGGTTATSGGSTIVPLQTISALGTATYVIGSNSIKLESDDLCGVDFSYFIVPDSWDGTSDFNLYFWGNVPTGESSKVMRLRMDYQIISAGTPPWSSSGYTTGSYDNLSVANQTTMQNLNSTSHSIPAASLEVGDVVYIQLWRDATNAADTYEQDLYVPAGYLKFNE
jgi:hypothetical protein